MSSKKPEAVSEHGSSVTILIVEDTEDNRFMLRRLLEMSGYDVLEARDGAEAVQVAQESLPRMILMDLSLPIIDGLAATRLIRRVVELERTPIIAVSAHDSADFQSEAISAGCNAYITKPIDFNELDRMISDLLAA